MPGSYEEELELLDIEEYARAGKDKRKARRYAVRIDRTRHEITNPAPNGRELLALVQKTPDTHLLAVQMTGGGPVSVGADQTVDLLTQGVERFMTLPREATEGAAPRRQFKLPQEDLEFLETRGEPWEAIVDQGTQWVLLHRFALPSGFMATHATAGVRIVGGYPDASLDMMYFDPPLVRADGKSITSVLPYLIDGRSFQEWSRHRPPSNPWRVGEDNLATHCSYATCFLADELKKH
jgi:hypothetical protein